MVFSSRVRFSVEKNKISLVKLAIGLEEVNVD
jgi:hypothetical protein